MTSDGTPAGEARHESPFAAYLGFRTGEVTHEHASAELQTQPHHLNPTGMIHGGVLVGLADNLATGLANEAHHVAHAGDRFMVGIDLHASMLSNQAGGLVRFEARPVRVGRRVVVVRTVVTGEDGRTLAEVTTTHIPA